MAGDIGSEQWWADRQRQRDKERRLRSEDFFRSGDAIPDIDFSVDCPICDGPLECDETFYCLTCNVGWGRNGYGHQAERFTDEPKAAI